MINLAMEGAQMASLKLGSVGESEGYVDGQLLKGVVNVVQVTPSGELSSVEVSPTA